MHKILLFTGTGHSHQLPEVPVDLVTRYPLFGDDSTLGLFGLIGLPRESPAAFRLSTIFYPLVFLCLSLDEPAGDSHPSRHMRVLQFFFMADWDRKTAGHLHGSYNPGDKVGHAMVAV